MREKRDTESHVAAFLAGDPTIHAELRRAVELVVRAFHFGPSTATEELVQEGLYRVFVSVRSGAFRGEASLRTFGQRIAENTCLEHLRRMRFRAEVDPSDLPAPRPASQPDALLIRAEEHRRNLRRLAAMSSECRELFRMIFVERLSYVEVARRRGISEMAVKLRVHRCRVTAREANVSERHADRRAGGEQVTD